MIGRCWDSYGFATSIQEQDASWRPCFSYSSSNKLASAVSDQVPQESKEMSSAEQNKIDWYVQGVRSSNYLSRGTQYLFPSTDF